MTKPAEARAHVLVVGSGGAGMSAALSAREAGASVLVTTNLPHEELEAQIGARTVSRLTQMCDEVPLFGDDRRYGKVA